jgi:hypothetical protein
VRRFYQEHEGVILLSQVTELIATLPLVLFVVGLAASTLVRARREALLTGAAVAFASVLTLVPPLLLVLLHNRASNGQVHTLAVLSDLTDVFLFATIAGFGACLWAGQGPRWFRWLALLTCFVAGVRAFEILLGGDLVEVLAPVAFLVLVIACSVLLLRRERLPASPPRLRQRPEAQE